MVEPLHSNSPDAGTERNRSLLGHGIIAGLIAGAVFAVAEMIVAGAMSGNALAPWKMFASILLGQSAVAQPLTWGVFLVGFGVHFVLAALFGLGFALAGRLVPPDVRRNYAAHSAIGMILGILLWVVNFQVIARALYPWFLGTNALAQILLHALAFGLIVALYLTAISRTPALGRQRQKGLPRRTTV